MPFGGSPDYSSTTSRSRPRSRLRTRGIDLRLAVYARSWDGHYTTTRRLCGPEQANVHHFGSMMQAANRETDKKHNPLNPTTPKSCQIYVSPSKKNSEANNERRQSRSKTPKQESPDFAFNTGGDPWTTWRKRGGEKNLTRVEISPSRHCQDWASERDRRNRRKNPPYRHKQKRVHCAANVSGQANCVKITADWELAN